MTGRELLDKLQRTGQERATRALALNKKIMEPEKLAVASLLEVCDAIAGAGYDIFATTDGGDTIMLAKREDCPAIAKMLVYIER